MTSNTEHSPELEPISPSTAVTTPEQSPDDDDIWASDDQNEISPTTHTTRHEMLSDLPTIKRQHMTDGYREGLAVGKAKVMQQGFDDGYPIGTQIALRAGIVLGILEGYLASKAISSNVQQKTSLQKIYDQAKEELSCSALLRNVNDEIVASATSIPPVVESVIVRWEQAVVGTGST